MNLKTLIQYYERHQKTLEAYAKDFPWENKEAYLSWLAQSYEYVRCSTRILALSAGHFPSEQSFLSNRFIQHAAEEKGHERLLLKDAQTLGFDLLSVSVLAEAEAFHKSLYYWIHHGQPLVVMGWVLCLEGFAVRNGKKIFERVEKAHGAKAALFLKVHAEEDEDHVEKAFQAISDLKEEELRQINHGLELYSQLYANIYQAIGNEVSVRSLRAA